jgi:hypothetical protein
LFVDTDLWQRLANELDIPTDHFSFYDRQENPTEKLLTEVFRNRTVGELYDILVKCDANALADKYL